MKRQRLSYIFLTALLLVACIEPGQAGQILGAKLTPVCVKPVKVFGSGYMDLGINGEAGGNIKVYCSGNKAGGVVEFKTYFKGSQINSFFSQQILSVLLSVQASPVVTINGTCKAIHSRAAAKD